MERVRRTKACLHLRKRKQRERLLSKRETYTPNQTENVITCSHDIRICHPYEDKINFTHALFEVLMNSHDLVARLMTQILIDLSETQFSWWLISFFDKCNYTLDCINQLMMQAYVIQNNIICVDPTKPSQAEIYRLGKYPLCGYYVDHAHHLIEVAKQYLASSTHKWEKKMHLKKLKFFQGLKKIQEIKRDILTIYFKT